MSSGRYGGHVAKTISVVTNVPGGNNTLSLKIEGDIWQAVEVKPPTVSFGRLTMDAAKDPGRVQKVTVTNNMTDEAKFEVVRSSSPIFQVESKVLEPGKQLELSVAFASPPQVGSVAGTIELSTGVKDMPTLSVPVSAYITPDVEVMPPNLALPQELPIGTSRQLFIQNNAATPIKVSDVQSSNPGLRVTLEEVQPGKKYKLNVDVPAGYKAPAGGDKISFKTDSTTTPQLTVMVTNLAATAAAAKPGATLSKPAAEGAPPSSEGKGPGKPPQLLNARQAAQKMSPRAPQAAATTMPGGS
jgi:hypothetical protein